MRGIAGTKSRSGKARVSKAVLDPAQRRAAAQALKARKRAGLTPLRALA